VERHRFADLQRSLQHTGGYSIMKEHVHPFRRPHLPQATRQFETSDTSIGSQRNGNGDQDREEGHG